MDWVDGIDSWRTLGQSVVAGTASACWIWTPSPKYTNESKVERLLSTSFDFCSCWAEKTRRRRREAISLCCTSCSIVFSWCSPYPFSLEEFTRYELKVTISGSMRTQWEIKRRASNWNDIVADKSNWICQVDQTNQPNCRVNEVNNITDLEIRNHSNFWTSIQK